MAKSDRAGTVQEAIGVFFDIDHLKLAIEELESAGFDNSEIGLLASEKAVEEALRDVYTRSEDFSENPNAPCVAFVADKPGDDTFHALIGGLFFYGATTAAGAAVASAAILGGAVVAAASGVAAIGLAGTVMGLIIHQSDADFLDEQVDEGHILLFVRTRNAERAAKAVDVLAKNCAFQPKVYSVPACR
jgi:hypothetical protein